MGTAGWVGHVCVCLTVFSSLHATSGILLLLLWTKDNYGESGWRVVIALVESCMSASKYVCMYLCMYVCTLGMQVHTTYLATTLPIIQPHRPQTHPSKSKSKSGSSYYSTDAHPIFPEQKACQ